MDRSLTESAPLMHFKLRCRADANLNSCHANNYDACLEAQTKIMRRELRLDSLELSPPLFIRASNSIAFDIRVSDRGRGVDAIFKVANPGVELQEEFGTHAQQFAKGAWCIDQTGKLGYPPVATTLASGTMSLRGTEVPWSIESKIDGKEVPQFSNEREAAELWHLTGRVSSAILRISPAGFGSEFNPNTQQFVHTWSSYLAQQVKVAKIESLVTLGALTTNEASRAAYVFSDVLATLDQRYPRALSHKDLSPQNNIFFTRATPQMNWSIGGVIDFEQAASVPGPVYEIAMVRFYEIAWGRHVDFASYLEGLGIQPEEYYGTQLERDCEAALLLRLCPELQWLVEHREHDYIKQHRVKDLDRILPATRELIQKLAS